MLRIDVGNPTVKISVRRWEVFYGRLTNTLNIICRSLFLLSAQLQPNRETKSI